jgi:hypothetical protein
MTRFQVAIVDQVADDDKICGLVIRARYCISSDLDELASKVRRLLDEFNRYAVRRPEKALIWSSDSPQRFEMINWPTDPF